MGLSDIAAGIEVTAEQRERGVATVDDTGATLLERLRAREGDLPCTPSAAATLIDAYDAGRSVGDCAEAAGVAPVTAAKALHRCGVPRLSPLSPTGRELLRDWLAGELPRADAVALAGCDEAEFALAAYLETHKPVPELAEAAAAARSPNGPASVEKRDALSETMSSAGDLP